MIIGNEPLKWGIREAGGFVRICIFINKEIEWLPTLVGCYSLN
jgi:hypothetical protein